MKFYTAEDLAEILQLQVVTVRRKLVKGEIEAFKIGSQWRVKPEDLEKYIESKNKNKEDF